LIVQNGNYRSRIEGGARKECRKFYFVKEGEAQFIHHAKLIKHGAAAIMMAFDEAGQAIMNAG
jgi:hypothetical protein